MPGARPHVARIGAVRGYRPGISRIKSGVSPGYKA